MITGKILKILVPPVLVCTLLWALQFLDACSDVTMKLVKCLIKELKEDREYELANAIFSVEKVSNEMDIEYMLVQDCQIHNKNTNKNLYKSAKKSF